MPSRSMATARFLLRAAAVFWILVYLVTAAWRARFSFRARAVEGHCLQQVCRVSRWPSALRRSFARFRPADLHSPLYFYRGGGAAWLFGAGSSPFGSSRSCLRSVAWYLIFRIVQKQTVDSQVARLATGLFAGSYNVAASWFDLAQVDSLFSLSCLLAHRFLHNLSHLPPVGDHNRPARLLSPPS